MSHHRWRARSHHEMSALASLGPPLATLLGWDVEAHVARMLTEVPSDRGHLVLTLEWTEMADAWRRPGADTALQESG